MSAKKLTNRETKRLSVSQLLFRRLSTIALWYVTLTLAFLLILAWVSTEEPTVVSYLVSGEPTLDFLTPAEASHMSDVRVFMHDAMLLFLSAVIILTVAWITQPLERGQFRAALVMHGVLVLLLIPFNWTFEKFHAIAFPQGNWQFPVDSWLITHFSGTFFAIAAFSWIALAAGMCYALYRTSAS